MKHSTFNTSAVLSVIAALALTTQMAHAAEQPVANDENSRVTIETSSVQPAGRYVQAAFWAYTGDERIPVAAVVDGCDRGSGKITYRVDPEDPGAFEKINLWSADGGQLTDKMAAAACRHANRG
jgi:hypothetical protein